MNDHDLSKEEYIRVLPRFKWINDICPIGYSVFTKNAVISTDIRMKGLEVFYHLNTYECKGKEMNGNLLHFITEHKDINCYHQAEWTDDETGVTSICVYNGSEDWEIFKYREYHEKVYKCDKSCREKSIIYNIHIQHNISIHFGALM